MENASNCCLACLNSNTNRAKVGVFYQVVNGGTTLKDVCWNSNGGNCQLGHFTEQQRINSPGLVGGLGLD